MKKPGIVPANSDWPMMYDNRLPNSVVFYHKFAQGNTDVLFKSFSDEEKFEIKKHTPPFARFVEFSKNFAYRMNSPKIDRTDLFDKQFEEVKTGLMNLEKLRDWIVEREIITGNNNG